MLELYREQVLLTPYVRKTYKDNPKMGRWITYKAVSCSYDLIKKGDLLTALHSPYNIRQEQIAT